jgi:predicted nucleotidyltransferase component of viral defense system
VTPKEFPGHLSALQFDVLKAFQEPSFFLTGGGALIGFYGHNRITRDLDLFTRDEGAFRIGFDILKDAVSRIGGDLEVLRTTPYFRRFRVTRTEETTLVDIVLETVGAVSEPIELPDYDIRIDTLEELAVNKICALVGRAEPRDLVDLHFLQKQGLNLDDAISQAQKKDGGVGTDTLLFALQGISSTHLDDAAKKFLSSLLEKLKLDLLPPE